MDQSSLQSLAHRPADVFAAAPPTTPYMAPSEPLYTDLNVESPSVDLDRGTPPCGTLDQAINENILSNMTVATERPSEACIPQLVLPQAQPYAVSDHMLTDLNPPVHAPIQAASPLALPPNLAAAPCASIFPAPSAAVFPAPTSRRSPARRAPAPQYPNPRIPGELRPSTGVIEWLEPLVGASPQPHVDMRFRNSIRRAEAVAELHKVSYREQLKKDQVLKEHNNPDRNKREKPAAISSRREAKVSREYKAQKQAATEVELRHVMIENDRLHHAIRKLMKGEIAPQHLFPNGYGLQHHAKRQRLE